MWLLYSSMTIVTLAKVSKLGGELEEERQLNKSLRENQEEWQVPKSFTSLSITPSLPCGHRHAWSELRLRWQCCSRKKTVRSLSYRNRLWGSPSLNVCVSFWNPGYWPWWSYSPPQYLVLLYFHFDLLRWETWCSSWRHSLKSRSRLWKMRYKGAGSGTEFLIYYWSAWFNNILIY